VDAGTLDYPNLTGRPPGATWNTLARLLPGVAAVQRQIEPYARAWHAANIAALAGTGRRWVVLGDSMSLGIGASDAFAGWVGQVTETLRADGVEIDVVNLSASGAGVADLLRQQVPVWRSLPNGSSTDVVSVLVGSNDLMSRARRDGMPTAFGELLGQLPDRAVVATMPQPRRAARAVNDLIESARLSRGIRVVDMRTSGPSSWRGRLAADHFHPNDAGYAAIAAAFAPQIRAAATAT
jgi:lysophospholipase L1-like esterase